MTATSNTTRPKANQPLSPLVGNRIRSRGDSVDCVPEAVANSIALKGVKLSCAGKPIYYRDNHLNVLLPKQSTTTSTNKQMQTIMSTPAHDMQYEQIKQVQHQWQYRDNS
jgi:hypothetical protein